MKVMAFNEARAGLKQAMETAQEDSVVITVHGKPAAMLVGVRGQSFDDLYTKSPEFWMMIQERQQSTKSYSNRRGESGARAAGPGSANGEGTTAGKDAGEGAGEDPGEGARAQFGQPGLSPMGAAEQAAGSDGRAASLRSAGAPRVSVR